MDEYDQVIQALPSWLARPLLELPSTLAPQVQEVRLRVGCTPMFTVRGAVYASQELGREGKALQTLRLTPPQMEEILFTLCGGSVHTHQTEIAQGYVTLASGCRAGLGGQFLQTAEQGIVLQELTSVNLRIAREKTIDLPEELRAALQEHFIGMLLVGEPGSGKTTVLRSMAQELARQKKLVSVIDERRAPADFPRRGTGRHFRHPEGTGCADGAADPLAAGFAVGRAGRHGRGFRAGTRHVQRCGFRCYPSRWDPGRSGRPTAGTGFASPRRGEGSGLAPRPDGAGPDPGGPVFMSGSSLRGFGALCLVLCGWCVGDSICVRTSEHQRALQRTIELLDRIRREIEFRRADLASLFVRLQREGLVGQAAGSLQELEPFPQLSRREKAAFQNCMAGLGRAEAQQECQRLALYITQFETFRDDLTPRLNVTMELAHKMGLSVGLAAAILLL